MDKLPNGFKIYTRIKYIPYNAPFVALCGGKPIRCMKVLIRGADVYLSLEQAPEIPAGGIKWALFEEDTKQLINDDGKPF